MKILYVTTIGITMGFFRTLIHELIDEGNTVDIACGTPEGVQDCYLEWGCKIYPLSCSRIPIGWGNIRAIKEIHNLVKSNKYNIVHCHTPVAAVCTRLACNQYRKKGLKVFYTAHGFHFYSGAPLKNWLIYYPIEWICSFMTDSLITINTEDYERAKRRFHAKRTFYVLGVGIDTKKFSKNNNEKNIFDVSNAITDLTEKNDEMLCRVITRKRIRKELNIPLDAFLLISVGEVNRNKNQGVIIRALSKLNDDSVHYIIAGEGPSKESYAKLAQDCGINTQVHILGFRNDIPDLYCAADVCVFPSIREGLGLAAIEGMASGLPLIVSDNRGTRGIINKNMAITCKYDDVNGFAKAIERLQRDGNLRSSMGRLNEEKSDEFDISVINKIMHKLYSDMEDTYSQ